ncbi:MAG: hypothetical protein IKE50_04635 [Erysipelotrichaceae bacterium]|nr:hypothetical protein [Erysipelotrichaceae bacterium]
MKNRQWYSLVLGILCLCLLSGCGVSKQDHELVVKENEENKAKIAELEEKIKEYEPYEDLIEAIKNDDYLAAEENLMKFLGPSMPEIDDTPVSEDPAAYVGRWNCYEDRNTYFVLHEDGTGVIGEETECEWEMISDNYGPVGITVYVDERKGNIGFLFASGTQMRLNSMSSSNMSEYLPFGEPNLSGFYVLEK